MLNVANGKVGNLSLHVCFTFQINSCNDISKNIMGYVHSRVNIEASEYFNHQWYVHTNNVKDV
jgi:hypothetical protein